ncbi:MAG: response regulator transcription factor [Chloroflexi bacterium]|nr:response regulator transcription factor [Chloroflexota bacterium]MBM3155105.1 response regulator transcription factor [Chloroflexota bacterium]MBM3166058.1 response regulator transcription factor [Chloroflexota bacterium]MBM3172998.1 response regulator transcription factor [Chloroflexota bacterium]MBM4451590.1 response regulator transcription factor [Chloroflexota bacterium]
MSKKILVIEDDPSTLRFIEYTLQQAGFEVLLAKNGLDGLRMAQTQHPDLIILDIMLPGLDGYEVCRRLRQKPATANILVLMLSAKARQEDKDTGMKMGADDYLSKPVDPSEIIKRVQSMLTGTGKVL